MYDFKNLQDSDFPVAATGPWSIPETGDVIELPLRMSPQQLQQMVLTVWREYMLHDEVLAAVAFLENAPYFVRHTPETEEALATTKATMAWMDDPHSIQIGNTPHDPQTMKLYETEVGTPLPGGLSGQLADRYNWISHRLPDRTKLVDFGCIDGTMTNRWGLAGHNVTGLDLAANSVRIANEKARQFGTGAVHVCTMFHEAADLLPHHSFDYATSADTYEHIRDVRTEMLATARQLLRPEGRMLLVTPHGSWGRGYFRPLMHPWAWSQEGEGGHWLVAKPRAHLVAPTVWSVTADFEAVGFWVRDAVVAPSDPAYIDVPGQGNVCVEAWANPPFQYPGKRIVFHVHDPAQHPDLLRAAADQAHRGNTVTIYQDLAAEYDEGIRDFVRVRHYRNGRNLDCDVYVGEGDPASFNITARTILRTDQLDGLVP